MVMLSGRKRGRGMTNEEAVEILEGAIKKPNTKDGYLGQALDMGIKAIKKLDAIETNRPPTDDWEHYSDKLYELAYKRGKEEAYKCADNECSFAMEIEDMCGDCRRRMQDDE